MRAFDRIKKVLEIFDKEGGAISTEVNPRCKCCVVAIIAALWYRELEVRIRDESTLALWET